MLLKEYNTCSTQVHHELTISNALDPSIIAELFEKLGSTTPTGVSSGKKREAMDAYLLITRSREEISLLEKEIQNVVHYYENRDTIIVQNLTLPSLDQFDKGRKALLCRLLKQNTELLIHSRHVLAQMVPLEEGSVPSISSSEDESDLSDNDDNDDF